ncbi:CoA-transferase family III domain-containing protein [Microdochium bolleyi]|uniref:CoA-transferase family III domain-containing protein n=1 Tax=Microdochium bolleyi TaxID=196109 RepID=A0A136JH60_9PEZI|nr:CoA-transferase family III domain-containing protein [Microdochium bolleyi]
MTSIAAGADAYGPGSWVDSDALPVPDDARRLLKILAGATPGFTRDPAALDSVKFTGSPDTVVPGPLKSAVIAGALHAMAGIVANELLECRDGTGASPGVSVDTDHAAVWLGSVGMSKRNGQTVREIAQEGKLASIFSKDLEKDIFATPLRLRTTANYETKDPGVWYQLHGSLGADPVLRVIGLDPATQCASNDEATRIIGEHVRKFSANELEMMFVSKGLCGSICYIPAAWAETRMAQDLARHPLINYAEQTHAVPTPAVPLGLSPSDKRPLAGVKVVELVRIIAGPVIGTTLAAFGADVIRVNCERLPDFNSLQLTLNAGVRTVDADLSNPEDLQRLRALIADADVFVQGYRPGVIARKGLGLNNLLEMAGKRGKGIVYVEEDCYGPDGPMAERPGWQQVADAASGCSYVTGRSLGHRDGTCVLPALPVPDILTGLIGAIGTMMAVRDRARRGGSYHVFASLMAAASLHLSREVGLYSPAVVQRCTDRFQWGQTGPDLFVLELLDVVLQGWRRAMPAYFEDGSPHTTRLAGPWGDFEVLSPVVKLAAAEASPRYTTAPEPNCLRSSDDISWL